MRKIIIAAMTMGLATGCYAGIEDIEGSPDEDRGGRSCYYSYYGGTSTSYTSNSDGGKTAQLERGAQGLTVKVDVSQGIPNYREVLEALSWEACSISELELALACGELPDIDLQCQQTCKELGGFSDPGSGIVCEPDCKPGVDCSPPQSIQEQLRENPYDGQYAVYHDRESGMTIHIYQAEEKGEFLEAQVEVSGPCSCHCSF